MYGPGTPYAALVIGSVSGPDVDTLLQAFRDRNPRGQIILCADREVSSGDLPADTTILLKPFTLPELLALIRSRLGSTSRPE